MKLSDFDYELPPQHIARYPAEPRDASRLLVLERRTGAVDHRRFGALPELLDEGDLLVLNDTRVLPARLVGRKATGGRVELLLLEAVTEGPGSSEWRALLQASRKPAPGSRIELAGGLDCEVLAVAAEACRLRFPLSRTDVEQALDRVGAVPLPPYLGREADDDDRTRYQTIFAARPGAVAAPTAGLHFTSALFAALERKGVERCCVTLHVGPGTFLPVREESVERHRMHAERYEIPPEAVEAVARARSRGARIVAVGTTVVRTLETAAAEDGSLTSGRGESDLFVVPGHRFRLVDALITNFHLPRSTLLLLVSAFAGREPLLAAYGEAIRLGYRFYSYGDAMLVRTQR